MTGCRLLFHPRYQSKRILVENISAIRHLAILALN